MMTKIYILPLRYSWASEGDGEVTRYLAHGMTHNLILAGMGQCGKPWEWTVEEGVKQDFQKEGILGRSLQGQEEVSQPDKNGKDISGKNVQQVQAFTEE